MVHPPSSIGIEGNYKDLITEKFNYTLIKLKLSGSCVNPTRPSLRWVRLYVGMTGIDREIKKNNLLK